MVFKTDKKKYEVKFIQKDIKRTYLRITSEGEILITSKQRLNNYEINKMLENHRKWLIDKLSKLEKYSFAEDEFMLFGIIYKLKFDSNLHKDYKIIDGILYLQSENKIKKLYQDSLSLINDKFYVLVKEFNLKNTPLLQFRKMKTRWGVCHYSKGKVVLNKGLIHLPERLINYVIYHELTHFYHPNHSKAFYYELGKYCPNYNGLKNELRNYVYIL